VRPQTTRYPLVLVLLWSLSAVSQADEVCVTDDADRELCLDEPAERIVALSPGATELLFAAGAGDQVVGTVSHSDYPEAAQEIPRVGTYKRLDLEGLLAREPDLVIGWQSGNPGEQLERLRQFDVPLYLSEPRRFRDVATTLKRLGRLAGTREQAQRAGEDFLGAIEQLRDTYGDGKPVSVFYQIWPDPLMTINNDHLMGRATRLCGGRNVFGDLDSLTPRINREAVLERDPDAIIAGGMGEADRSWLEPWRQFEGLQAVQSEQLFFVPPSMIQRPTPRLVKGVRLLCRKLESARGGG
jgi:iron complex transport system substrate-binding protein